MNALYFSRLWRRLAEHHAWMCTLAVSVTNDRETTEGLRIRHIARAKHHARQWERAKARADEALARVSPLRVRGGAA